MVKCETLLPKVDLPKCSELKNDSPKKESEKYSKTREYPPQAIKGKNWKKESNLSTPAMITYYGRNTLNLKDAKYGNGKYAVWSSSTWGSEKSHHFKSGFEHSPANALMRTNQYPWASNERLFTSTKDVVKGNEAQLMVELPVQIKLESYKVGARNGHTGQSPSKWQLLASNDAKKWVVVDERESIDRWTHNQVRTFEIENSKKAFSMYKLVVQRNSNASANYVAVKQFRLFGKEKIGSKAAHPMTKVTSIREYPPKAVQGETWTKKSKGKSPIETSYGRNTLKLTHAPYANGDYTVWGTSAWNQKDSNAFKVGAEWAPKDAFNKYWGEQRNFQHGWHTVQGQGGVFNRFRDAEKPAELVINMPVQIKLRYYHLIKRAANLNNQMPYKWTLSASNDNKNWTVIDKRVHESDARVRGFGINNNKEIKSYSNYKLTIYRTRSGKRSGDYMSLGEMKLLGVEKR
jgi:hypothetical protein